MGLIEETEKCEVINLGTRLGFGRLMQLATICWREVLEKQDLEGGEFVSGPCESMTVKCICRTTSNRQMYTSCDWCCGCGWVTKKVRQLQDQSS